ncbi:hypothetical protein ACFY2K_42580 [Kitasatospora sp. NPDC001309]|uniref:hypothetical protein n=1 Tax=Kitasatospora sp. NPDC001309 TaxID=3364013 RepID=UPI0036770690
MVRRGRGFPSAELIGHVRDHFGPELDPDEWEDARSRSPYMAPQRAAAADWDGGQSIEWTLYVSPGTVRIGSHDSQARERAALRACQRREASVKALHADMDFADAVRAVGACHSMGLDPSAAELAAAAEEARQEHEDVQLAVPLEPAYLNGKGDAATRRNRESWWQRVIEQARLYPDGEFPEPTKRGRIFGLSERARQRMTLSFGAIDYTPLVERAGDQQIPIHTLTYGDDWLSAVPDGRAFHEHMDLFWRYHERAWGRVRPVTLYLNEKGKEVSPAVVDRLRVKASLKARQLPSALDAAGSGDFDAELRAAGITSVVTQLWQGDKVLCLWKLEFQRRGAPHVHILMCEPKDRARVPKRGIRPVGAGCTYKTWLSRVWNHIVYGTEACANAKAGEKCEPLRQARDDAGLFLTETAVIGKDVKGKPIRVEEPVEAGCPGGHGTRAQAVARHAAARRCPHAVAHHRKKHHCTRAEAEAHLPGLDAPCNDAARHIAADAAKHLLAGTAVDYDTTHGITDPASAARYFAKHGQFNAKRYQDEMPDEWQADQREASKRRAEAKAAAKGNAHPSEQAGDDENDDAYRSQWREQAKAEIAEIDEAGGLPEGWIDAATDEDEDGNSAGTGRIWGYKGLRKAEKPTRVTAEEAQVLARLLRKHARAADSTVLVEEEQTLTDRYGLPLLDGDGEPVKVKTGKRRVEARATRKSAWSPEKPGADEKRHGARHGGKHANPRMANRSVERHQGGRAVLAEADGSHDGITYWTTDADGNAVQITAPVRGLAALQYLQPTKVIRRKSLRRMHRFRNSGTPSGWMIVPDGESMGVSLAQALADRRGERTVVGLAAGLALAGHPAPPRPAGVTGGRIAELRAKLAHRLVPEGVDPHTGEIAVPKQAPAKVTFDQAAERFRNQRSATVPDRSSRRHLAQRFTVPAPAGPADDRRTPHCADCGGELAPVFATIGAHLGCRPDPMIERS